jgi:hypothetical protein
MVSLPKDHHDAEACMRTHAAQQLPALVHAATDRHSGCFARIEDAIAAIRAGKMVIVADDEDREHEGDLTISAEKITPEAINFMAKYGRGLICLAMTPERLDELEIPLMVANNGSRFETAFCVRPGSTRLPESQPRIVRPRCSRPLIQRPGLPIWFAPATCSHFVRRTPESCDAPGKQKLLWTWRGWPAFVPPELSARS